MVKLDVLDKKILYLLEQNARQAHAVIAKKLKTSPQVISYRIQNLEKQGVISGYFTIINFAVLGYSSYRTMIRLSNIEAKTHATIIAYLQKQKNILWISDCGGRWDLIINILAKNAQEYYAVLHEIRKKFPEQIQNYDILMHIDAQEFGRDYFIKKIREPKKINVFAKQQKCVSITATDAQLLKIISTQANMHCVEIARLIGVSPNTVINRLKELQKQGIIQAYKPFINLENISSVAYKALIKFQNHTEQEEKKLIDFLHAHAHVVGILKFIGMWDFEIEFEFATQEELLTFTRTIRDMFKNSIRDFEILPLYHQYKYDFFPEENRTM